MKTVYRVIGAEAGIGGNVGKQFAAGGHHTVLCLYRATGNKLIDKRISKSQQMRWSLEGGHLLLQVRTELIGGRLGAAFSN